MTDTESSPSTLFADLAAPTIDGRDLQVWRKSRKLTQVNLADLLHVNSVNIGRWESNNAQPSHDLLRALFILGAPVMGSDNENSQPMQPQPLIPCPLPFPQIHEIVKVAQRLSWMNVKALLRQAQTLLQRQNLT